MARRRRKKSNNDTLGMVGKIIIVCLVVLAGYFTYKNYGNKILGNDTRKEQVDNKDKAKNNDKEEKTETTNTETNDKKDKKDDNKGEEKYTYHNQEGENVTIKADKSVEATGFAGASNHKFFLRGTTLYYRNISSGDKEVVLAYNVEDLYLENKEVTAVLSKDGKIVEENNYITYIKK
ncbi:MAG: hypothetical protein VZS44_06985 [Bacilli bacterium]|nr:hypothetical protein [Bacilli bacterium]